MFYVYGVTTSYVRDKFMKYSRTSLSDGASKQICFIIDSIHFNLT